MAESSTRDRHAPAFWAVPFTDGMSTTGARHTVAERAMTLSRHPQAFGNYFSYGACTRILGLDPRSPFVDGSLRLSDQYVDLGYMWSQLGPPESAVNALAQVPAEDLARYLPDLSDPLRELVATRKFKRTRCESFDVLGTEGAQGAIGYAALSFLARQDEVLITDPGYMHFATAPALAGANVRTIPLTKENCFRLDPDEVAAAITPRTKMLVLCDPINPFGTVQTKAELLAIVRACERRRVLVLNNITHATHQTNPRAIHTPVAALHREAEVGHVLSAAGMSKGYALAALRLGFLAGAPPLLAAAARVRMEVTGIHTTPYAQHAALAALADTDYVTQTTAILRRNLSHVRETLAASSEVSLAVEPDYGFCACLDVGASGVSSQELTVALFKQGICVIAGDALGEVGATRYLRINYSARDITNLQRLREALPLAIRDAQSRSYLPGVQAFYQSQPSRRAKSILAQLERLPIRRFVPVRKHFPSPRAPRSSTFRTDERRHSRMSNKMHGHLPPSFLTGVEMTYGPIDVLSAFFTKAYDAAKGYGVHLALGTFDDLLRVNLANQRSWRAIIPTFDPRFSDLDPSNSFCLLGYNEQGEIVATQACRLFSWRKTNFFEAAENLTLFYANPSRDCRPGETCEVTAQAARQIHGRVAFSGAGWYRPDYRGKYLSRILPRISRAYAFTRWSTDYTTSMFQDSVLAGGMAERCGYRNIDWKVHVKGSPMGDIVFAFVWMESDPLIDDLRSFGDLVDAELDGSVRYRSA